MFLYHHLTGIWQMNAPPVPLVPMDSLTAEKSPTQGWHTVGLWSAVPLLLPWKNRAGSFIPKKVGGPVQVDGLQMTAIVPMPCSPLPWTEALSV